MDAERLQRLMAEVALKELGEDQRTREQGLKDMRSWVNQNTSIITCRTDDNFLLRFLRTKKYDLTKAQQMLYNFLDLKNVLPSAFLGNHDVGSPSIEEFMCNGFYFGSPNRDNKGQQVIMVIIGRLDLAPQKYTYDLIARTILLTNLLLQEDEVSQVLGYTYVFDAANLSMASTAWWPSPIECVRFIKSGEAAIPMMNKEIHILNLPPFLTWFVNIVKTALNKKLQERIVIHSSVESLRERMNPRVLPQEYGGEISTSEMIDLWKAELERNRETIRVLSDLRVVKKTKETHPGDLVGTFRKLEVD